MNRKQWLNQLAQLGAIVGGISSVPAFAFEPPYPTSASSILGTGGLSKSSMAIASASLEGGTSSIATGNGWTGAIASYKSLSLPIDEFGVTVPVACWYPSSTTGNPVPRASVSYKHRISVRRIGQLLAKWNFIPEIASRDFTLSPTNSVTLGENLPTPTTATSTFSEKGLPVVILAHGYLGSRFDLSHLAERLAASGFVCVAPEYPESLAASYDRMEGLDRSVITQQLVQTLEKTWNVRASQYGIIGHSLGCGTALETGDESWARVLISGFPRAVQRNGSPMPDNILYVISTNDGVTSRWGGNELPSGYDIIKEANLPTLLNEVGGRSTAKIPTKAIYQIDRPDGPNHISFLSEGVNDAMIDLLSPLLPVAQAFDIPVLDFDRYQKSRDSVVTAEAYQPLVMAYLQQQMLKR